MTIRILFRLSIHIVFLLALVFVIFFKRIKKINKLLLSFSICGLYLLVILVPIFLNNDKPDFFDEVQMKYENSLENLTIKEINNRLVLYDQNNNEIIKDNIKYRFPVYIKTFDDFYLIIYSSNSNANYSSGYFRQANYERYNNTDKIVILSKRSPKFINPILRDITGKIVDLNRVKASPDCISLPVLVPHEEKIAYIYNIYINPKFDIKDNFFRSTAKAEAVQDFVRKDNFLQDYLLYGNYEMVTIDSNNKVFYHKFKITYHSNSSSSNTYSSSSSTYIEELLKNEQLVKEGFIKLYNGVFYYLGDDMKLYYLDCKTSIYVRDVEVKDNWIDYIPNNN